MPKILYAFSGPAWALKLRMRLALNAEAPAAHRAIAQASVARLQARAAAGLTTWTFAGRRVKVDAARLMRCVAEEVEP